ncbi:sarcosine oxidase subunit alpha family protein [Oceanobacter mangrovi]|uniref:sarcosine oxidase subunit alpha family protein n=1 Tax=Oceanobacter mangrovi TaxID=2862510 RepID=UPI001C8E0100|nr:sarcosine oxidase subunit alpha family protein [Oceanobacter mangrovi]
MAQVNRIPSGGRINRGKPLTFTYNGKQFSGYEGDTLASALLANGVNIIGRSFKYSRPRGIIAAGAEEPNAVMQVGASEATQIPNVRATQQALYGGLVCSAVAGWPNVDFDLMSYIGKIGGKMMPPGFYYKTFMGPAGMWPTYEKYIRKAAGLGKASKELDVDIYDHFSRHADVVIVGAGPTGLAAAQAAASSGARVILADEQEEFGGSLLHSKQSINGKPAAEWVAEVIAELAANKNVLLLPRATVNGLHDHNFLTIHERLTDHIADRAPSVNGVQQARQRIHKVRAHWVVLATGAQERPIVFGNNDIPGVMLASAVTTYINRYGVVPGNKLVVGTANDDGYEAAIAWQEAGREVAAIVDSRPSANGDRVKQAQALGIKVIFGSVVYDAAGQARVKSAKISAISADGKKLSGQKQTISCDTIATSGGWSPVVHLSCHSGPRPVWDKKIFGFVPGETHEHRLIAGGIRGHYELSDCLSEGQNAGVQAAEACGFKAATPRSGYQVAKTKTTSPMELYIAPHDQPLSRAPKQFVDFQNDVTAGGIELAIREGFESIEHVKRYTALGFGTDQGKLGNINGMAIAAQVRGLTIPEVGTTVFRPNYTPVTFGAIAGRHCGELFDPKRYTAMHSWHVAHGALFEDVGQWKRPWYYPKAGESMQDSLNREVLAVRNSVGILDASTLGKIDIQGKDAREFLGRIYTNAWAKLGVGKCRYGLMCGEDGMVFDDGVTSCLADNHFLMTTTTGGAARVLEWLELYHQTEWPELEVFMTSVTDHWATMTISGPNSRKLLAQLTSDIDLDKDGFKFMDWRAGTVAGVPARVFRISFTGELSYEINVPANYGLQVWNKLMEVGAQYDITPYGTEVMHILRAEKGFIIAGQDTDGSVTPYDLGMGWAVSMNKEFSFIGKRGMNRQDPTRDNRKQLVGIKTKNPSVVLTEGMAAINSKQFKVPAEILGHVTSSYYSATLGRSIAMGVIKNGLNRMGETVYYPQIDGTVIEAEICSPVFYDPKGDRQNV